MKHTRMSDRTLAALRHAVEDPGTIARYRSHILRESTPRGCQLWTGAVAGNGHGRLWIGSYTTVRDGRTKICDIAVIAHRYGWALHHGVRSLLMAEQITHRCDEPLCQTVDHWRVGTNGTNQTDYSSRVSITGSPLRDVRGARGRAVALRDAARDGLDVQAAADAGQPLVDRLQPALPGLTD